MLDGKPVSHAREIGAQPADRNPFAPAYVETPEFDLLHDQGNAYAQASIDEGVEVEHIEIKGDIHGFDLLAADSTVSKNAMQRRVQFLRRVFSS